jgi:exodeoxyribonuclease VII large subunit
MKSSEKNYQEIYFQDPISVSDYILVVNQLLSGINVKIFGEVSEVKIASSGHLYFALKDEKSGDMISCALWSSIYRMCGVKIEDGMKVIVTGTADIYKVRGTFTFKVKTIELAGEGALKKAYDELKRKLEKEGIFAEERKRAIPKYPRKIGLITSLKGAAIHDFINNLGRFGFKVFLCDSRVEGQEAVEDLIKSLKVMKKIDIDVLAIVRGGGSLQSLIAFDNEMLVREVANFPVPVITGIGHHEDVPLVALAADYSQSTPTAVANYISGNFVKASSDVLLLEKKIENSFQKQIYNLKSELNQSTKEISESFFQLIEVYKKGEEKIRSIILNSSLIISSKRDKIKNHKANIFIYFKNLVSQTLRDILEEEKIILASDPKRQLNLGYAIMKKDGKIVKSVKNLKEQEELESILFDGKIISQIKNIKKNDQKK